MAYAAMGWLKSSPDARETHEPCDAAKEVIRRHMIVETELIEKATLKGLTVALHDQISLCHRRFGSATNQVFKPALSPKSAAR